MCWGIQMVNEKLIEVIKELEQLLILLAKTEVRLYAIKKDFDTQLQVFTDVSSQLNEQYDKILNLLKD
jgi:hypothetical protein